MKKAISFAFLTVLIGCNDPHKVVVPKEIKSWESNDELKQAIQKLPEEEKKVFVAYVARMAISQAFSGSEIPIGTTIGQAIDDQKRWQVEKDIEEAKQKALAEKLEKEKQASLKKMNEALTATLMSLSLQPKDFESGVYSDYFQIKLGLQNNTDKELIGVKGVVVLKDIFGEVIKKINLAYDENIKPNGINKYTGTFNYNQFIDDDKKLASTSFEKVKFEWEPTIYLFKDGQKLEMPQ